jgi:uncharacterized protein (TIGR03118 family)
MAVASPSALTKLDRSGRGLAPRRAGSRVRAVILAAAMGVATLVGPSAAAQASTGGDGPDAFRQVNLVSDLPGVAPLLDKEVKNPWGIALGPDTPLWVNNNFNPALATLCPACVPKSEDLLTKITLYSGANGHDPFTKVPLEVTASAPTGMVFNPTASFVVQQRGVRSPARFLFNELVPNAAGTAPVAKVTGWSNAATPLPTTTANTAARHNGAFYFGLALIPGESGSSGGPRLVAVGALADNTGVVDVFDGAFHKLNVPGAFVDPNARALAPYNVAYLHGRVYISYTSANGTRDAVSVFTPQGRFIKRLVTGGPLAGPWGMVIAPEDWGDFGGALLVGNVNDGRINAFDPGNGHLLGTVTDAHGHAIVNPGLWGLAFGNGVIGTPRTLLFAAGIGSAPGGFGDDVYAHGLVGLIRPVDDD